MFRPKFFILFKTASFKKLNISDLFAMVKKNTFLNGLFEEINKKIKSKA